VVVPRVRGRWRLSCRGLTSALPAPVPRPHDRGGGARAAGSRPWRRCSCRGLTTVAAVLVPRAHDRGGGARAADSPARCRRPCRGLTEGPPTLAVHHVKRSKLPASRTLWPHKHPPDAYVAKARGPGGDLLRFTWRWRAGEGCVRAASQRFVSDGTNASCSVTGSDMTLHGWRIGARGRSCSHPRRSSGSTVWVRRTLTELGRRSRSCENVGRVSVGPARTRSVARVTTT
jgi:hypothetical protein